MKDKYFLLNGRSYPDTVTPGPLADPVVGRPSALLAAAALHHQHSGRRQGAAAHFRPRVSPNTQTLASLGIPMHVIGFNAKLLRDQAGNNMDYYTNSITLGGGESLDVILDASDTDAVSSRRTCIYLYTPQSRSSVQRRRELRRADDRSAH